MEDSKTLPQGFPKMQYQRRRSNMKEHLQCKHSLSVAPHGYVESLSPSLPAGGKVACMVIMQLIRECLSGLRGVGI